MKMMNKVCALVLSVALCAGMAAPAFAYGGEPVEEAEQPVLTSTTDEEDAVTVTDEENGALTPEGNLTLVDDYHTSYSDGSGQQFIGDFRVFRQNRTMQIGGNEVVLHVAIGAAFIVVAVANLGNDLAKCLLVVV